MHTERPKEVPAETYRQAALRYRRFTCFWLAATMTGSWFAGWWGFLGMFPTLGYAALAVLSFQRAEMLDKD